MHINSLMPDVFILDTNNNVMEIALKTKEYYHNNNNTVLTCPIITFSRHIIPNSGCGLRLTVTVRDLGTWALATGN